MSIELHCEGCGKLLRAPAEKGGKRGTCPACGHEVYIPTAAEQVDELSLAPEDASDIERERALQAERRRLERQIARERENPSAAVTPSAASRPSTAGASSVSLERTALDYLVAMRDSDLTRADEAMAILLSHRQEARQIVDRLIADQLPPTVLADVPPAVYQGFLKNLRSQL